LSTLGNVLGGGGGGGAGGIMGNHGNAAAHGIPGPEAGVGLPGFILVVGGITYFVMKKRKESGRSV
jgi:hypothetical protein